jgi:hypothetical protein
MNSLRNIIKIFSGSAKSDIYGVVSFVSVINYAVRGRKIEISTVSNFHCALWTVIPK